MGSKARFTLLTTSYVDARTWMYGAVSLRTLTQDTSDANYMILTTVVSGHNCVAVCHHTATDSNDGRQRNATCHHLDLSGMLCPSIYDDAIWTLLYKSKCSVLVGLRQRMATYTGVLMWAYHVWPAAAAGPSTVRWEGSHLVRMAAMSVKLRSTELGL